jgi:hypothetical protein
MTVMILEVGSTGSFNHNILILNHANFRPCMGLKDDFSKTS